PEDHAWNTSSVRATQGSAVDARVVPERACGAQPCARTLARVPLRPAATTTAGRRHRPRRPRAPTSRPALPAEAALALRVAAQRAKEVDLAEVRQDRIADVVFRERGLQEQEPADPLLPGGTDDEIWVRLAFGVE